MMSGRRNDTAGAARLLKRLARISREQQPPPLPQGFSAAVMRSVRAAAPEAETSGAGMLEQILLRAAVSAGTVAALLLLYMAGSGISIADPLLLFDGAGYWLPM